jgi:hypothetical protein
MEPDEKWAVLDAAGREVMVPMMIQNGGLQMNVGHLAAGNYYLRSVNTLQKEVIPFQKK